MPDLISEDSSFDEILSRIDAMRVTFTVIPGNVTSKTDGDTHFVGFSQLIECFCVPRNRCFRTAHRPSYLQDYAVITLVPQYAGNYKEVLIKKLNELVRA